MDGTDTNRTADRLTGRVALVTGAAGGIGSEVATALGECGVAVAVVDRSGEALERTRAELEAKGVPVVAYVAEVSDPARVEALVDGVEERLGPIDYLVNCAGVLRTAEAVEMTDDDWTETLTVNATGVFVVSRAVVRRMVARGRGGVVTIASNAAGTPRTGMGAYAASKAAATAFTKCLGLEVARHGIRCNVVAPGSTATPMLTALWDEKTAERVSIEGAPEKFRLGIPLQRVAQPADIADAVLFLLSDRSVHITMQELVVDGGATL